MYLLAYTEAGQDVYLCGSATTPHRGGAKLYRSEAEARSARAASLYPHARIEHHPDLLPGGYAITPWKGGRNYALFDAGGDLIAVTVYKRGAKNVAALLHARR